MVCPHAVIIGGGVTGMTTAWTLLDRGYEVSIIAAEYCSEEKRIASQIAGALWEWPPAVCGKHNDPVSLEKSKRWCMVAYNRFKKMALEPHVKGVKIRMSNFFFKKKVETCPYQLSKMKEIQAHVDGFRHDAHIIEELGVNSSFGVVDAYQHLAPVIDTDAYMAWLTNHVATNERAHLYVGRLHGDLLLYENLILKLFKAHILINCAALGAKDLANDHMVFPMRGALIRVVNDGLMFPQITQSMCLSLDREEGKEDDFIFILPRNDTTLVLGGLVEPNQWELDINIHNHPPLMEMYERNLEFYPPLENAKIDPSYPIAIGLRPFRGENVRVGRETRLANPRSKASQIIHNYGHGGSGFSLSFGCAEDVANIADSIMEEIIKSDNIIEDQDLKAIVTTIEHYGKTNTMKDNDCYSLLMQKPFKWMESSMNVASINF